jgi:hypothetical protein
MFPGVPEKKGNDGGTVRIRPEVLDNGRVEDLVNEYLNSQDNVSRSQKQNNFHCLCFYSMYRKLHLFSKSLVFGGISLRCGIAYYLHNTPNSVLGKKDRIYIATELVKLRSLVAKC